MIPTNPPYFKYGFYPKIFARIDHYVADSYSQLKRYLVSFTGNLAQLTAELEKIDQEFEKKITDFETARRKEPEENRPLTTQLGKLFLNNIGRSITQTRAFKFASVKIRGDSCNLIDELIATYHLRCAQLIEKFSEIGKDYSEIAFEDDKIKSAYQKSAQKYIETKATGNEKKIKKSKNEYLKAKNAALNSHEQRNIKAARTSLLFESLLTEFEELELYREVQTQNIINTFADSLFSCGNEFVLGKSDLYKFIRKIDPDAEANIFENEEAFRPANADDRFQTFRLPPSITLVLTPEELFPPEIREGRSFVQVTKNYKGPPTHLVVIKDEILLANESELAENEFVKCQNINESVGLLPSSILAVYQP